MVIDAATHGLGVAIGRPVLIAPELEDGTLVPILDDQADTPDRSCLITTAASRQRPEVQAFRHWILQQARTTTKHPINPQHPRRTIP